MRPALAALAALATVLMAPLSAQFRQPEPHFQTRELRYSLSDRAYVAIFVILPGRGVALLYPFNAPTTPEGAGDHAIPLESASLRREQRVQALLADGEQAGQAYLLLVASRVPLRLTPYVSRQDALDSAIGPAVQRGLSMDAVVTSLVKLVVNVSSADDVAYDVDQSRSVIPRR
ncbi:MAG TPA: hypothetical protein VK807_21780 [Gemmatimonadaceae bacterium]|nr:hypothetical protein [Gemmatimonadaceae bacterium]